jgi:hypothetical protein
MVKIAHSASRANARPVANEVLQVKQIGGFAER